MYKIITFYPSTPNKPFIQTRELYDQALLLYRSECISMGELMSIIPNKTSEVHLLKQGKMLKKLMLSSEGSTK